MGNCCGKQDPDAFSQPGRVLGGSASSTDPLNRPQRQQQKRSSAVPRKVGGPARTLGGSSSGAGEGEGAAAQDQARRKAAEAAEARANKAAGGGKGGKLQSQLSAQKRQTREDTLRDASEQVVKQRDVEEAAQARAWE